MNSLHLKGRGIHERNRFYRHFAVLSNSINSGLSKVKAYSKELRPLVWSPGGLQLFVRDVSMYCACELRS